MKQHSETKDPMNRNWCGVEPRRSKISKISKSFGADIIAYALESEPQIFKVAMSTSETQIWKEAINNEKNPS